MIPNDITRFAKDIKETWHTDDPFVIAEKYGIFVTFRTSYISDFTAETFRIQGYPTIISINADYDDFSRRILCAHELGHALLHNNGINHYAVAYSHDIEKLERDANLFAITLISDDINSKLNMPVERMSNYILKSILDYNLTKIDRSKT